jgi:hypothetical protein
MFEETTTQDNQAPSNSIPSLTLPCSASENRQHILSTASERTTTAYSSSPTKSKRADITSIEYHLLVPLLSLSNPLHTQSPYLLPLNSHP